MSCHTIGGEDSEKGPDLTNVLNKRSTEWLVRYIQSPERMREEKDSASIELKKKFPKISMPSFDRYSENGIKQLVEYLGAKSSGTNSAIASELGDKVAGRYLSTSCTNCHGNLGITKDLKVPNLAGQNITYLINQLKAYKSGMREDPKGNMNDLAQSLSIRDIVNISTYFSSLK